MDKGPAPDLLQCGAGGTDHDVVLLENLTISVRNGRLDHPETIPDRAVRDEIFLAGTAANIAFCQK